MGFYVCPSVRPYVFTILALDTEFHESWYKHYAAVCHVEWRTVVALSK